MNRSDRQRGFSLTELLVAVAVGSLVIMGVYQVFMNSMNVFQSQQEVSQIQFNAKAEDRQCRKWRHHRRAYSTGGVPEQCRWGVQPVPGRHRRPPDSHIRECRRADDHSKL